MSKPKQKKYNRLKVLKKASRDTQAPYGKAGAHKNKNEKRKNKPSTKDYLNEEEE